MAKYTHPLFIFVFQLVVLVLVMSVEQVQGVPLVFLGLGSLWLEKRSPVEQLGVSVLLGIALASAYLFSLALGFLIVLGCVRAYLLIRSWIASQTTVLLIVSIAGASLTGFLGQVRVSWIMVLTGIASILVLILISKLSLTHHIKRSHL